MPKILSCDNFIKYLSYSILILLIWASLWSIVGKEAEPLNGSLFHLILIYIIAYILGELSSLLHLPPLLGMLISGFICGNAFNLNLDKNLSSILRSLALVIILLRAGLESDPKVIKRLSGVCLRLAFIPCIVEAITVAIVSHLLLGFPFKWGFLLGFVLAAVSPAVVVPEMIVLQEKQLGTDKGIPTLIIAAASVDNVLAITGFGVCLSLVFDSGSSLVWSIIKGPVEAFIGILFGIMFGIMLWFIPSEDYSLKDESNNRLRLQRLIILLLSGIVAVFGSTSLGFGGSGALGCLVVSFVSALKWRSIQLEKPIQQDLKVLWLIFQPFLFALIGVEVKISNMNGNAIGFAMIALLIGLTLRSITASVVVFGADLNLKEKVFISIAWLTKATVQAAVGPIALDFARNRDNQRDIELATLVLTIAVLSILITAPLGAIAISIMGPKCLKRLNICENENDLETNQVIHNPQDKGAEHSVFVYT